MIHSLTCSASEIQTLLAERNQLMGHTTPFSVVVDELTETTLVASGRAEEFIRVGGIVPGPVLMALADCVGWMITMTHLPRDADALTTDMSMQFLRALPTGAFVVEAELLSIGRSRATIGMRISAARGEPVASTATLTFAPRLPR